MRYYIYVFTALIAFCLVISANELAAQEQDASYSYAYIEVKNRALSKKFAVEVDLGDSPEQIKMGAQYAELLSDKKSRAAILNFMAEKQYELVEILDYTRLDGGTGGTSGLVFIMRKRE